MKTTKRNVALALVALFTGQLLISCSSSSNMQWSKNDEQKQTFATTQFMNKAEAEKTAVVKAKEFTFNAQPETEAVVLASTVKEIPVATQKTTADVTVVKDVNKVAGKETKINKIKEQLKVLSSPEGVKAKGKNQWLALILCGVVGYLGIHRFYLGYYWQGVVQLLTAGGCGIWTLIDFIRILLGKLQPKDGSYTEGTINF